MTAINSVCPASGGLGFSPLALGKPGKQAAQAVVGGGAL